MSSVKRRQFLKGALATSAISVAPFNILKAGASPNSKLNIAVIGVGGQGTSNAMSLQKTDNLVAFCDVDVARHKKCIAPHKSLHDIPLWKDYREMFEKMGDKIDAVCIATPEHGHFAISMAAIRQGKHVYCQKPLCHTVQEVRTLTEEAAKSKVITQMGHQGHSGSSSAAIRDWGLAETIGPVREFNAYSRKNYWTDKPLIQGSKIPKTLDWSLYLNRAGMIPFSESYMNRNWIDYSHFSGCVGDMGGHTLDPGYYGLDLRIPLSVHAEVPIPYYTNSLPRAGVITWKFAARGKKPPVTMRYYLGPDIDFPFPKHLEKGRPGITAGSVIVGEKASIMSGSHSQGARIIPEAAMKDLPRPPKDAFRCKGRSHFENWTLAIKGEDKIMSPFSYAGPLSEIIVLGDVALMHPGKTLLWDSKNLKITNDKAANNSLFMQRLNPRDNMNWY